MKIKIPNHFRFSTFVWLTSVLITATFFASISKKSILGTQWDVFSLMVSISFVCSIPNWILLWIATWKVSKFEITERKKKIIINIIAVILTFTLFSILYYNTRFLRFEIGAPLAYSLTLTISIWIFPLQKSKAVKWDEQILDNHLF